MKVYENNKMLLKELIYHIKRSLTQEITKDVIEYDIVIPFHKETLTTLPHVIKSLEKFLSFRVIYVVGPLKLLSDYYFYMEHAQHNCFFLVYFY